MSLKGIDNIKKGEVSKASNCDIKQLQTLFGQSDYASEKRLLDMMNEEEFALVNDKSNSYIKWLIEFIKKHDMIISPDYLKSKSFSEEDKDKIEKLHILFSLVSKYAVSRGLTTKACSVFGVKYKEDCLAISNHGDMYYAQKCEQANIDFEDIIDAVMKDALEDFGKTNDDPEFIKNRDEAFAEMNEQIMQDIKASYHNEDRFDEIFRALLNACDGERDDLLLQYFPEILKEYNRITKNAIKSAKIESIECPLDPSMEDEMPVVEPVQTENKNKEGLEEKIKTDPYYIKWLVGFISKNKLVDTITPIDGNNEDKQNAKNLDAFYKVVSTYAKEHDVGEPNKDRYIVSYRDAYFLVGKTPEGATYAIDSILNMTDIDYETVIEYYRKENALSSVAKRVKEDSIHSKIYQNDVPCIPSEQTVSGEIKKLREVLKDPLYQKTVGAGEDNKKDI